METLPVWAKGRNDVPVIVISTVKEAADVARTYLEGKAYAGIEAYRPEEVAKLALEIMYRLMGWDDTLNNSGAHIQSREDSEQ